MLITNTKSKKNNLEELISNFALFFLFLCVSHQLIFCLINTHLYTLSRNFVVLFEFTLILLTSILFFTKINIKMFSLILFIFANCFLLGIFKNGFDPKHIRNFLIPILVIWLGANSSQKYNYDRLLKYFAVVVIAFGLFEGFFAEQFQKIINVLRYQIAMGMVNENVTEYLETTFALNGVRVGGRNFLSFLFGDHRISSIFLESASMSNTGVVIVAWGLAKDNSKNLYLFLFLGLLINVLSDSRFGLTIIFLLIALRYLLPKTLLRPVTFFIPIFVVSTCFVVYFNFYENFTDTFKGRLGLTGEFLLNFKIIEFFGAYNVHYSTFLDTGYPFILHNYGIIFTIVMWVSLFNIQTNSITANRFKYFIATIISCNLAIGGDAIYALKMSGLMWFLMGILTKDVQLNIGKVNDK
jgi:putative polymerase